MQRAVWPVHVVVIREHAKHALEVSTIHDQEPVEALRADGADKALGDGVRLRSPHWRLDDLNAFAGEDGVEVARELAVTVTDQETKPRGLLLERVGCAKSVHAAWLYSWMSPPRRSRRSTPAEGGRVIRSFETCGAGGVRCSERCGLCML